MLTRGLMASLLRRQITSELWHHHTALSLSLTRLSVHVSPPALVFRCRVSSRRHSIPTEREQVEGNEGKFGVDSGTKKKKLAMMVEALDWKWDKTKRGAGWEEDVCSLDSPRRHLWELPVCEVHGRLAACKEGYYVVLLSLYRWHRRSSQLTEAGRTPSHCPPLSFMHATPPSPPVLSSKSVQLDGCSNSHQHCVPNKKRIGRASDQRLIRFGWTPCEETLISFNLVSQN